MSNSYCTITQLGWFFDTRQSGMLSNDANSTTGSNDSLQALLDAAASEIETHLAGRVALPILNPPLLLTRLVAAKAAEALYLRRADVPKGVAKLIEWANGWLSDFDVGKVGLPSVPRSMVTIAATDADAAIAAARSGLTETL